MKREIVRKKGYYIVKNLKSKKVSFNPKTDSVEVMFEVEYKPKEIYETETYDVEELRSEI